MRGRMRFQDALDVTPDDLPDGAYFAMAHEIAGLEYGDGFDELAAERDIRLKGFPCSMCGKRFHLIGSFKQHNAAKHGGRAVAREGR